MAHLTPPPENVEFNPNRPERRLLRRASWHMRSGYLSHLILRKLVPTTENRVISRISFRNRFNLTSGWQGLSDHLEKGQSVTIGLPRGMTIGASHVQIPKKERHLLSDHSFTGYGALATVVHHARQASEQERLAMDTAMQQLAEQAEINTENVPLPVSSIETPLV